MAQDDKYIHDKAHDSFIEAEYSGRTHKGAFAGADVYLSHRGADGRTLVVLTRGAGSGIQANITASVIASMIINYAKRNEPILRAVRSVLDTFGGKESSTHAAFSVVDIQRDGTVRVAEYEAPRSILLRNGKSEDLRYEKVDISTTLSIYTAEFKSSPQDRIVLLTDGVIRSGLGTQRLPLGWSRDEVIEMARDIVTSDSGTSAQDLAIKIITRAEMNDLFMSKNDLSCASIYFRKPRRLLLCSGPPFNETNDRKLADRVVAWEGTKIISGGTTASILARELHQDISVNMRRDMSGLPPTSSMNGIDMITEGVLTLAKVKTVLEQATTSELVGKGTDYDLSRMLLRHDIIEFLVGTRINAVHQDPNLPVELELRRNVVKEIKRLLETKFMKDVKIEYI